MHPLRISRGALARLVVAACLFALFIIIAGSAHARPRYRSTWTVFGEPGVQHVLPRTDDGGRLWRWASGGGSNIVATAERYLGAGNFTGTQGPWCADAVSAWLRMSGHRPLANRMAASALVYGPHVSNPKPGDLVVQGGRHGAQHVGVFLGWVNGSARIVSGNWGHRVAIGTLRPSQIISFVRT